MHAGVTQTGARDLAGDGGAREPRRSRLARVSRVSCVRGCTLVQRVGARAGSPVLILYLQSQVKSANHSPSSRWQGRLALPALPRIGHARGKVLAHRVLGTRAAQVVPRLTELHRRARCIELTPLRCRAEAVVRRVHDPHERRCAAAAAEATVVGGVV